MAFVYTEDVGYSGLSPLSPRSYRFRLRFGLRLGAVFFLSVMISIIFTINAIVAITLDHIAQTSIQSSVCIFLTSFTVIILYHIGDYKSSNFPKKIKIFFIKRRILRRFFNIKMQEKGKK